MELKIYLDVQGWERNQADFYPFTGIKDHPKKGKRYCFTVNIPDPMAPDEEEDVDILEVKDGR